ncbi:MAG: ABC transporter permease subunit [Azospirillum sp.]|nr:ABC transporter permease subunit [Azospirillum sp.]
MATDSPPARSASSLPKASLLGDPRLRGFLFQALVLGAVVGLIWFLASNTIENLERRSIATGFHFIELTSSFAIGESLINYSAADSYGRAIVVGLLNTLKVALAGIVLATILGTLIGVARLSSNWLLAKLAAIYVEVIRNIPLLLQLFLWYSVITESLPQPRQAMQPLPNVYLSNRGLMIPVPADHPGWTAVAIAMLIAIVGAFVVGAWAKRRQAATGQQFPVLWANLGLLIGLPFLVWLVFGAPTELNKPVLGGFNFRGGAALTPELAALLMGLVIYTASYIAEIVRSGILAVNKGQTEAGLAIGLHPGKVLRLIILPQALRIIVPPMTSQYLNLTKNSSLAVAIGYPDVVSVLNTTINQTGQAIEGVAMIMAVFLTISLSISAFMNWYNKHIALVER